MFSGIIEETGIINYYTEKNNNALIKINCKKVLEDTKIGDSIAVNGVCQTVCELGEDFFSVQASSETLRVTNFSKFKRGTKVNLERALTLQSRLGGHIVTGHVDSLVKVLDKTYDNKFCMLKLEAEKDYMKYIAQKGSVTLNGISLTVADIYQNTFTIAVIPHTLDNTTLNEIKTGDFLNLEVDILAKYVEKFLSRENNIILDEAFLKENGF